MGSFIKNIKRLVIGFIALILIGIVAIAIYFSYVDANNSKAKTYLIERYGLDEKKLKPKKYIQYIYEDVTNCDQEWIKKCTDDENLQFQYIFDYDGTVIVVSEDKKASLTDDYDGEVINDNKDEDTDK
ncbi:MAG TPA: hypothetical protein DCE23_09675 [Firmicutes bacterium]|nr:hypothetical protein [Bacillota bacterium]